MGPFRTAIPYFATMSISSIASTIDLGSRLKEKEGKRYDYVVLLVLLLPQKGLRVLLALLVLLVPLLLQLLYRI
jgi:hypothetical protein